MNRTLLSAIALAVASLSTSAALAAGPQATPGAVTRDQVRAEQAEAIRTGNVVANSESGQKANELMPHLYPRQTALQTRTRAEVQAELSASRRGNSRSGHAVATVDSKR